MEPDPRARREMEARVEAEGDRGTAPGIGCSRSGGGGAGRRRKIHAGLSGLWSCTEVSEPPAAQPAAEEPGFEAVVSGAESRPGGRCTAASTTAWDSMISGGWVGEVDELLRHGYTRELSSMSGIGYSELAAHLEGEVSVDEAVRRTKSRTHRFVRQQYNWFPAGRPTGDLVRGD